MAPFQVRAREGMARCGGKAKFRLDKRSRGGKRRKKTLEPGLLSDTTCFQSAVVFGRRGIGIVSPLPVERRGRRGVGWDARWRLEEEMRVEMFTVCDRSRKLTINSINYFRERGPRTICCKQRGYPVRQSKNGPKIRPKIVANSGKIVPNSAKSWQNRAKKGQEMRFFGPKFIKICPFGGYVSRANH